MVSTYKKRLIWMIYIPVALLLIYLGYYTQVYVAAFLTVDYILFLLIAILVALFPIKTEDSILVLTPGISLATLLVFGLIPEIILSSLALTALMIKSKIGLDHHYRYPLNLLMFYFLSIISAGAYYLTFQLLEVIFVEPFGILALTVYMLVHLFANQLVALIISKYFYNKEKNRYFDENLKFSLYTSIFVVPLTFVLIFLYDSLGVEGIVVGALPFLTVTVGINFYFKSRSNNLYLKKVNYHSQQLNAKKDTQNVLDSFLTSLIHIFPADNLSYFSVQDSERMIRNDMYSKNCQIDTHGEEFQLSHQSILKKAVTTGSILAYSKSSEWKNYCNTDLSYSAESALVIPVKIQNHIKGVVLLTHQTRSMYDEMLVSLVEGFHQYFSIALENAYHYERLEESSETDYLTELPNLKGFSKHLETIIEAAKYETLSLIVMDLDRFKRLNDTHGHQAGNDVLKQVARVLKTHRKDDVYIARYGGEEFIMLLCNFDNNEAYNLAETIRYQIENTTYEVDHSIKTNEPARVSVTASLGVATHPTDCSDVYELITLADRAMYMGSKQKGRNKVTMAHKGS